MLKKLTILVFVLSTLCVKAQPLVTNSGLALTVQNGLTVTIQGDFVNQTSGSLGTITTANGGIITVSGNWTNNSANNLFTAATGDVHFLGLGTHTIGGTGNVAFNTITINKGPTIASDIVDVTTTVTVAGVMTSTAGLLRVSAGGNFTNSGAVSLPANTGIHINGGIYARNGGSITNTAGLFRVTTGTGTIGTATGNSMTTSGTGTFDMQGGTLSIAGRLENTNGTCLISGGTLNLSTVGHSNAATGAFNMSATTVLTMSGTPLVAFVNQNANASRLSLNILSGAGAKSITGGTFQIGNASTPITQTFIISSPISIYDLTIFGTNSPTAQLSAAIVGSNDITINANGTLDPLNLNITSAGNWLNNGTFTAGTGTVIFNSTVAGKTIAGTLTGATGKFNNLTFNGIGGGWTFSNDVEAADNFTITNGTVVAPANLTVTGNWSNAGTFTHNSGLVTLNSTAAGKTIAGTLTGVTGKFNNLTFNGIGGGWTFSDDAETAANFTISNGTVVAPANLTVSGNWSNSETYTHNSGLVTLNGAANQTIGGTTIPESFHNLTINNSNNVTLNKNITLSNAGILTLSGGSSYLELNGNDLTIPDWTNGDIAGFTDTQFIIVDQVGFIKTTNVATASVVNFPMGLAPGAVNYARADVTQTHAATVNYDANLCGELELSGNFCSGDTNITVHAVKYTWNIVSPSVGATVKVFWDDSQKLSFFDRNYCSVVHYDASLATPKWVNLGFAVATSEGGTLYSRSGSTTGFSPIAVQDSTGGYGMPLPIELKYFRAEKVQEDVNLEWATASETNNDYFILERSITGYEFTKLAQIEGAGNSQMEIKYEHLDIMPPKKLLYYRLVQVDYNGKSEIFPTVSINNSGGDALSLKLKQNPTSNSDIRAEITTEDSRSNILFVLQDMLGKQYYLKYLIAENQTVLISDETIPSGIYIITASQNDKLISKKLIIH